ncbi:hypothetical protein WJX73_003135 [Symbiochloris irregularis]|uniref:Uncharacterized protein n=1 Tax=Symbiochloris irregularis TaxID=706552 RepID=A0AAW1NSA5_9CHLO
MVADILRTEDIDSVINMPADPWGSCATLQGADAGEAHDGSHGSHDSASADNAPADQSAATAAAVTQGRYPDIVDSNGVTRPMSAKEYRQVMSMEEQYQAAREQNSYRSYSGGLSTAGSAPPDMDAALTAALSPAISSVQGPARQPGAPLHPLHRPPRPDYHQQHQHHHRHQQHPQQQQQHQQLQHHYRPRHMPRTQSVPHSFEDLVGAEHLMPSHAGFLQEGFASGARPAALMQPAQQAPTYTHELNAALNTIFGPQDWAQEPAQDMEPEFGL